MTVKEISTYEVTCDRCGDTQTLDYSPVKEPDHSSEYQFWTRVGADGPWATAQRMLCTQCVNLLELFLCGPAGNGPASVFNRDEVARYQEALDRAHDQYARGEGLRPWEA